MPIARLLMLSDFNLFDLAFQLLNACAQLAAKTYSLDIPCSSPPMPSIKIRRNLCKYLTIGSVWIRSFVRSLKALRRYRCSRRFSRSARAACGAAVTIFPIRHLKTIYRQNYRKAFSLVFSALEFSLNQFFTNKPTELPCFDITHPRGI